MKVKNHSLSGSSKRWLICVFCLINSVKTRNFRWVCTQFHLQNWRSISAVPLRPSQYLHENGSNPLILNNVPELHEMAIY